MRILNTGLTLAVVAAAMCGCASDAHPDAGTASETPTNQIEETKTCSMQSGGKDVLRLTVPADAAVTPKDGSLDLKSRDRYIELWLVANARTVDEAVARAPRQIIDEFKNFKAVSTTDLTVAGTPAKRLVGAGNEADDEDPGQADLIVFKAGDHVFIACTHGEYLAPAAQQWLLTVVQTAQAP